MILLYWFIGITVVWLIWDFFWGPCPVCEKDTVTSLLNEDQVTSQELSKRLKKLGAPQDSLWYWYTFSDSGNWDLLPQQQAKKMDCKADKIISAFTIDELFDALPEYINVGKKRANMRVVKRGSYEVIYYGDRGCINIYRIGDTLTTALAKMLIYLIENKLIDLGDSKRLLFYSSEPKRSYLCAPKTQPSRKYDMYRMNGLADYIKKWRGKLGMEKSEKEIKMDPKQILSDEKFCINCKYAGLFQEMDFLGKRTEHIHCCCRNPKSCMWTAHVSIDSGCDYYEQKELKGG
jgi:hypothetical protein